MTFIKPQDNPTLTTIYSKNNCAMCKMTKQVFEKEGIPFVEVNIEESGEFDNYVNYLKERYEKTQMPFVIPTERSGMSMWTGFNPTMIKHLKDTL